MKLFGVPRAPAEHTNPERGQETAEPSSERDATAAQVVGERGIGSINRASSLQSRITNALAIGLMSVLGVGLLGWYYAHTFASQGHARRTAQSATRNQAQGDMPLPPLGPITPTVAVPAAASASPVVASALGPPPALPAAFLAGSAAAPPGTLPAAGAGPAAASGPPQKSPQQLALERKLSGPAFDDAPDGPASPGASARAEEAAPVAAGAPGGPAAPTAATSAATGHTDALSELLTPTVTAAARPTVLPTQRLLLPKGAFIDCTLETAVDSTLPGMTTCVTATDTFGADGSTVLLERGTKLVGETRGEVQQGAARVFVLWTEARTPTGVVIPLASPGTDELGRAGLSGTVARHFWQRFGAAILISMINGGMQYAVESQSKSGAVIYDPGTTQEVMADALRGSINIAPTVTIPNGARIQVLVARDLDFRSVYALRPTH